MMEFYNDAVHKATKNHKCDLCCHLIPKGQKYHRQSEKYDGDFFCQPGTPAGARHR